MESWECSECKCKSFALVDEKKDDGSWGPSEIKRCVECKLDHEPPELKHTVTVKEISTFIVQSFFEKYQIQEAIDQSNGWKAFLSGHPDLPESYPIRVLGSDEVVELKTVIDELLQHTERMKTIFEQIQRDFPKGVKRVFSRMATD